MRLFSGRGRARPLPQPVERPQPQTGPDAFALIQAYEDHFSCSIEWMKLRKEGLFGRRAPRPRG